LAEYNILKEYAASIFRVEVVGSAIGSVMLASNNKGGHEA
jgi:hypothetical protein